MASCPACGGSAAEHAARGQQAMPQPRPHEWQPAGDINDLDRGWLTIWRCRACGATCEVPSGTTGDTLRAYQRSAGDCPGVRR